MRIELPDGQWADLRDRITHGQDKEIRRARIRSGSSPAEEIGEAETVALRIFVKAWHILDTNGDVLPLEAPDAIDRMPSDLADALLGPIADALQRATVPNAPSPPSSAD
jgi:hypothetical protein